MARPGPVERVRRELAGRRGPAWAGRLPDGYQRLGRVVLVRWPEALRPEFPALADRLRTELHAETVLRFAGPAEGEDRVPRVERLAGGSTETEVREDGVRYRFDAARLLYSAGNRAERARMARLPDPSETVADLFAGIGYFALPIARHARPRRVIAVERNPESFASLRTNVALNGLEDRVDPVLGDNRTVALPIGGVDRVLLGYLPDARPWIPRALELLRPEGGWVHVHLIVGAGGGEAEAVGSVRERAGSAGSGVRELRGRRVKAYGPGREHWVVDLRVGPALEGPAR